MADGGAYPKHRVLEVRLILRTEPESKVTSLAILSRRVSLVVIIVG